MLNTLNINILKQLDYAHLSVNMLFLPHLFH